MREIKFRAWNIPNKLMYQNVQDGLIAENEKGQLVIGLSLGKLSKDAGSVIMQFTGSKGKNEVEIYEGDIVIWTINNCKRKAAIYYDNSQACFWMGRDLKTGLLALNDWQLGEYEVIGNIYENPELL